MGKMLRVVAAAACLAFRIPKKLRPCEWIKRHVVVPPVTGAIEPGPLDTGRMPPIEGLHDLLNQRHVRYFTLMKSARIGGTLFCFSDMLRTIGQGPSPILWVDPSRASARQLFRREIEPFLLSCKLVARQAILDKQHWTASQCFFKGGSFLRIAGAGSPNELAGFQAERIYINEGDKVHHTTRGEAPAHELAKARSKQFWRTRKIVENSTPTDEHGPTNQRFLAGTQHHCYFPCPHCTAKSRRKNRKPKRLKPMETIECGRSPLSYEPGLSGWQRLEFSSEEKEVPFDPDLVMLPRGTFHVERTGQFAFDHCRIVESREVEPGKFEAIAIGWDFERMLKDTRYRCAHCAKDIIQDRHMNWMLRRYRWMPHNAGAPRDHVSAHIWAAMSPFESWGELAKKFVLCGHNPGLLHDFNNNDRGRPHSLVPTEVDENDIVRLQKVSPSYMRRTIPLRPELLTMTIDVQEQTGDNPFWWSVWAWGIHWDQPNWPTWAALIDYGSAVAWSELEEIAGITPVAKTETFHAWKWRDPKTDELHSFTVFAGLVDSGDQAQSDANVYDWCRGPGRGIFSPSKGGGRNQLFGQSIRVSVLEKDTPQELHLVWYRSDYFAQRVYRQIIKDRRHTRYLPVDLDPEFIAQVTDERTMWRNGKLVWEAAKKNNHLGDCWKMNEVLSGTIEEEFDKLRVQKLENKEILIIKTDK